MVRGNVWVRVWVRMMWVMLGGMVEAFYVSGVRVPGPWLTAVAVWLFLTAVFLLCHLRNAEQLLVVTNLRQLKDALKNLLITVCY